MDPSALTIGTTETIGTAHCANSACLITPFSLGGSILFQPWPSTHTALALPYKI